MKITKVTYQKAFIDGPFLQSKIGFEAEIDEHIQSVHDALSQLKGMAEDFHKESNPHLYINTGMGREMSNEELAVLNKTSNRQMSPNPTILPTIDRSALEKLEIAIDNADSIETLASLKEEASKHGLVYQYMNQLKKLTNGNKD